MNLVWLRNDLRLEDNPALINAAQNGDTCCLFIVSPKQWQSHDDSLNKIQFWRDRLLALSEELKNKNIPLKILTVDDYSDIPQAISQFIKEYKVKSIFFNHEYALNEQNRDKAIIKMCQSQDIDAHTYHADVICEPGSVRTQSDSIYHVFTPFARQWRKHVIGLDISPAKVPKKQKESSIKCDDIKKSWPLDNISYRRDLWPTTSKEIRQRLHKFIDNNINNYENLRDIPSVAGTSTLSPYLACGAISVRQCISAAHQQAENYLENTWVSELIWREFYRHLIAVYPKLSRSENFKETRKPIPWENNEAHWEAWCKGETGYPIVDAAMKQLVQTGWMHNRLRMIVAAFLTKLLLIDWRKGEQFFMEHLLDGDYASNNGGWQWAASTGADAAPYFRIFNPERQSQRFDPEGKFIKKLLPQLSSLDKKSIHTPSSDQRDECNYPEPIIDYKFARQRALDGYAGAMGKTK